MGVASGREKMGRKDVSLRSRIEAREWEHDAVMYSACTDARDGLLQQSKEYDAKSLEYGKKIYLATCREENAWRAEKVGKRRSEKYRIYCCCCGDIFPIAEEPAGWTIGEMRSLEHASFEIRYMFPHGVDGSHGGGYLCGNCHCEAEGENEGR